MPFLKFQNKYNFISYEYNESSVISLYLWETFMLRIHKKRVMFILIATILPVGMFMMQTASNNTVKYKTFATMATPVENRTIVVDAGHRWGRSVGLLVRMVLVRRILICKLH